MKKLLSILALTVMASSFAACTNNTDSDGDSELLDGILANPDAEETSLDSDSNEDGLEEEPYIEGPTELPELN